MIALITPLVPLFVSLIFRVLNSRDETKELAKDFAQMGSKINEAIKTPANLKKSYDAQGDRLDQMENKKGES